MTFLARNPSFFMETFKIINIRFIFDLHQNSILLLILCICISKRFMHRKSGESYSRRRRNSSLKTNPVQFHISFDSIDRSHSHNFATIR